MGTSLSETMTICINAHIFRPHLAAMSNLPASVKVANVQAGHEFIYTHQDTHSRLTDAVWTDDSTLITIGHGRKMVTHAIK